MLTVVTGTASSYILRVENRTSRNWSAVGPECCHLVVYIGPFGPDQHFRPVSRITVIANIQPGQGANLVVRLPRWLPLGEGVLVHRLESFNKTWELEISRSPIRVLSPQELISSNRSYGINVIGYHSSEKGIGEAARSIVRGIHAAKIPCDLFDILDAGSENHVCELPISQSSRHAINLFCMPPDAIPHAIWQMPPDTVVGRWNIGYWFWELPKFPDVWFPWFDLVKEVWVSSSFTLRAISAVSPVPVVYMPMTLSGALPQQRLTRESLNLDQEQFIFLYIFDLASTFARKNPDGVIKAFQNAFPEEKKDVQLILKFSHGERYRGIREIHAAIAHDDRISCISAVMSRSDVQDLIALCDCYVSLHRSEGVGLTCAEAMAQGKPVIATGWSGNLDFMNDRNSYLVQVHLRSIEVDDGPYLRGNIWAEPDLDHASQLMREVYERRDRASERARFGQRDVRDHFNQNTLGQMISDRLEILNHFGKINGNP